MTDAAAPRVEPARRADAGAWLRLRAALWPDEAAAHAADVAAFLAGTSPHVDAVLVARAADGDVVGFVELRVRAHADASTRVGVPYVEGWYVEPAARGGGVGRALLDAAAAWARARGYDELCSDAELDNAASQAAHRALGFEEVGRVVLYRRPLGPA